jgi:aryl-alcohol dehydrogenase-like predicted oxidoreductase
VYQLGTSEEIVGRAITRYSRREDIVLATKVRGKMHDGPSGEGLSRKAILEQVDASLTRLGTDYIDLYQIHRFDADTPVEETMEALHDVINAGKVRYIGASSMYAWQFAKLQHAADSGGWTRFVSMQNQYNLLPRRDERELMAMCGDMGVGLVPYSPNRKGRFAPRPASRATVPAPTLSARSAGLAGEDHFGIARPVPEDALVRSRGEQLPQVAGEVLDPVTEQVRRRPGKGEVARQHAFAVPHQVRDAGSKDHAWLTEPGADEDVFKTMSANRRDALPGALG